MRLRNRGEDSHSAYTSKYIFCTEMNLWAEQVCFPLFHIGINF